MRICSQATHVQTFDHAQQNTIPLYDYIIIFKNAFDIVGSNSKQDVFLA